jgi:hypothetical protein
MVLEEKYKVPGYVSKFTEKERILRPVLKEGESTLQLITRKHSELTQLHQTTIECLNNAITQCFVEHLEEGYFYTDDFSDKLLQDLQNVIRRIMTHP